MGAALVVQRFVVLLVSLAACCGMAAQLLRDGHQLAQEGQRTMVLEMPLGALSSFMGLMSGVAALALLALLGRQLLALFARRPQ